MSADIGNIIFKLREERGYTQAQLGRGVYSTSEIAKIESGNLLPGPFQLDRLLGRLGKASSKLEYILSIDTYEIYELQYFIQTAICHLELERAKQLLKEYENKKIGRTPLHQQFIEQQLAQISYIEHEDIEITLQLLERAIGRTMPLENGRQGNILLSTEEIKLLLFRWEVCRNTPYERPLSEVQKLLEYLETHEWDHEEKVKVYPYAVLLLAGEHEMREQHGYLIYKLKDALKLLRNEGRLYYVTEILGLYIELSEEDEQSIQILERQRNSLIALEEEFNIYYEKYHLFNPTVREFELDYEIIQRTRTAKGIVQEDLCEGICAQETLSRIERGKAKPSTKHMNMLLRRLNKTQGRINMPMITEDFETLGLKREFEKCIQRHEAENAWEILKQLNERIDTSIPQNKQFIRLKQISKKRYNEEMSNEQAIAELYDCLQITVGDKKEDIFQFILTTVEMNIINTIAILYYNNHEAETAISLYRSSLANYEKSRVNLVFHIRQWELQIGNLGDFLEETHQIEEAIRLLKYKIKKAMEIGKGTEIGRSLVTIACALEQKKDIQCRSYFEQAMEIFQLTDMKEYYTLVKNHMEELD